MRKVLYKRWIPAEWPEGTHSANQNTTGHKLIPGTGRYEDGFSLPGIFLAWGIAYEDISGFSNAASGHYTMAIVEIPGGTVEEVLISNIKFID